MASCPPPPRVLDCSGRSGVAARLGEVFKLCCLPELQGGSYACKNFSARALPLKAVLGSLPPSLSRNRRDVTLRCPGLLLNLAACLAPCSGGSLLLLSPPPPPHEHVKRDVPRSSDVPPKPPDDRSMCVDQRSTFVCLKVYPGHSERSGVPVRPCLPRCSPPPHHAADLL